LYQVAFLFSLFIAVSITFVLYQTFVFVHTYKYVIVAGVGPIEIQCLQKICCQETVLLVCIKLCIPFHFLLL